MFKPVCETNFSIERLTHQLKVYKHSYTLHKWAQAQLRALISKNHVNNVM